LPVSETCEVAAYSGVFAIGDVTHFIGQDQRPLPALAPVAKQQGVYVAKVIASRIGVSQSPGPFRYRDRGTMAVIGRSRAVAVIFGLKLQGRVA
jgi:NADH dehydrogenase